MQPPRNNQVSKRDLLPTGLRAIKVLLDRFQRLKDLRQFGRLVHFPILLRRQANARTVRSATLVAAAERSSRRPGSRDQLGDGNSGCKYLGLQGSNILLLDQFMIHCGSGVLPQQRLRGSREGPEISNHRASTATCSEKTGLLDNKKVMKAGVLYSGGKDSSLAAIMLGTYYEVELNTFVFDPSRQIPSVEAAARALGYPLKKRIFEKGLLNEMADLVVACGYPNDAINTVHRIAVETLSREYQVVGDGTRFNDRVPMLTRAEVQSLATGPGVRMCAPCSGMSNLLSTTWSGVSSKYNTGRREPSGMATMRPRSGTRSGPAGPTSRPSSRHATTSLWLLEGKG